MRCTYCDSTVPDDSLLCPICGFSLGAETSLERGAIGATKTDTRGASPGLLWYAALSLLASALLLATIGLGLLGVQRGLEDGRYRAAQLGQEYYRRGLTHLQEGNYLLALAEFEEAVRLAPDNSEAQEQLAALQALVGVQTTPTSAGLSGSASALYAEASALYAEERWGEVITRLEEVRRLDSSYRTQEVGDMLFNAYHREGQRLIDAGELEEALARLDNALEIRPDDPDAAERRLWLSLYMMGLSQWGVDWETAVETFEQLHGFNPSFLDVEQRLHDAHLNLGDVYFEEGAWCVAETQYGEALKVVGSQDAATKHDRAHELCVDVIAAMTPSAAPSVVPAESVTPATTAAPSTSVPVFVGEFLGYAEADTTEMRIKVCIIDAQGVAVPGVEVEISANGWRADPRVSEADGCCEFAGLRQELEFTVALTELPCIPVQVSSTWGAEAQVNFVEW